MCESSLKRSEQLLEFIRTGDRQIFNERTVFVELPGSFEMLRLGIVQTRVPAELPNLSGLRQRDLRDGSVLLYLLPDI